MPTNFSIPVNNYQSAAQSARAIGGTTLYVSTTTGLPALTGSQWIRISVFRLQVPIVILKVTAIDFVGHVLTIDGPVEGADAAVEIGDTVAVCDTAGMFSDIQGTINSIESGAEQLPVLATNSTTYRYLNDRFGEVFNVKDWGATGNGTTDDAPAIQAILTYIAGHSSVSSAPATIYFPAGSYLVNSTILVAKRLNGVSPAGTQFPALNFVGQGYSTQIKAGNPLGMTEIIRMEDCAVCRMEGFRILCANPVTVAALHVTAVASGENNVFRDIYVDANNICPVAIGVSLDYDNDTSQINFHNCTVSNATKAGFRIGNGTSGNVLDIRMNHCEALHNQVGVWMDAAPVIWQGGATTNNTVTDFFMSGGSGGPIIVEGVRSENSNMFFKSSGGGDNPPIRISDVQCSSFGGVTYNFVDGTDSFTNTFNVEGFVISHHYAGVLTIMNCSFWYGQSPYFGGRLNVSSNCHVVVINCMLGDSGGTASQYFFNHYATGGFSPSEVAFTAIGGKTVTSGGTPYDSPIDFLCNGPAFFSNTVALNALSPTSGFYQVGGSHQLKKIADPTLAPVITNVGTAGTTTYTYYYVFTDQAGNKTLPSPAGTTTTGNATLSSSNYNVVTIPSGPGEGTVQGVDILRGDTGHYVILGWNPYSVTPNYAYHDTSAGTSAGYSVPTRNATADMLVDGNFSAGGNVSATGNVSASGTVTAGTLTGLIKGTTGVLSVATPGTDYQATSGDASLMTVIPTGGASPGRTLAAHFTKTWFNALDYGIMGDGVTDDQPAIMALLAYVSNISTLSNTRRTIYFPAGTYMIGSPTNNQGIVVAKRLMQKNDLSYPSAGTQWPGISIIGDGYPTQFSSNSPSGLTELIRLEDTAITKIGGFRLYVAAGKPVTIACLHVTALASGEAQWIEDINCETAKYSFAVSIANSGAGGKGVVTGSGTSWLTQLTTSKTLVFASDSTQTHYSILSIDSDTQITLTVAYGGTLGSTIATLPDDGFPVGIGFSLDAPNDIAQIFVHNCRVTGANYAGFMAGNGIVGNVLDIRLWGCQSIDNPFGVFGFSAPLVWHCGIMSFNWISDIYINGTSGAPSKFEDFRSEGSNRLYVNNGSGQSFSPVTLSNIICDSWSGITWDANLNGPPPFYPFSVTVSNGSANVTGVGTFWSPSAGHGSGNFVAGSTKVVFNDGTGTVYTISTVTDDTHLVLTGTYSGSATSTTMGYASPVFTLHTDAGLSGSTIVTVTNGSAVVTGTAPWTGSLTTAKYLVFGNDPHHYPYSIQTINDANTVTLGSNRKGNTVYVGPSGLTTVKCALVEGYAIYSRAGGVINLFGIGFSHGPTAAGYNGPRFSLAGSNTFVTAIGVTTGASGASAATTRDGAWFGGGSNLAGSNYFVIPGPQVTGGNDLWQSDLGLLCSYQANFQRQIAVGAFNVAPTAGYHQQGGSMRLQAIPTPVTAPTVSRQGSAGGTTYYYAYVFRDIVGNPTMISPASLEFQNSQAYGSFTTSNFNKISISVTYGTSNPSYIDILRSTDGSTWTNVVHSTTSNAIQLQGIWTWNPYVTHAMNASTFTFDDQSTTAPTAYTAPARNATADLTIDGVLSANGQTGPYPGSGGTEINGAQPAGGTYTSIEQRMLQTVYNLSRALGFLA